MSGKSEPEQSPETREDSNVDELKQAASSTGREDSSLFKYERDGTDFIDPSVVFPMEG